MSSYYYLMAQLPAIMPDTPAGISYSAFMTTAANFLSRKDLRILENISLEPPRIPEKTGSDVVDQWYKKERALRLSLERIRSAKLKREVSFDPDDESRIGDAFDTVQIAKTAAGYDDPLEAEQYLYRTRFAFAEQLAWNRFFNSEAVFAYCLMLLLHERCDSFTVEAGRASYSTIYNQILGE